MPKMTDAEWEHLCKRAERLSEGQVIHLPCRPELGPPSLHRLGWEPGVDTWNGWCVDEWSPMMAWILDWWRQLQDQEEMIAQDTQSGVLLRPATLAKHLEGIGRGKGDAIHDLAAELADKAGDNGTDCHPAYEPGKFGGFWVSLPVFTTQLAKRIFDLTPKHTMVEDRSVDFWNLV